MQETIIILTWVGVLWIWFGLRDQIELEISTPKVPVFLKWIYYKTDFKPLNCDFCLTFWVCICLVLWNHDPIYCILPMIYRLIKTYERR